jgi:phage shock protein PspC (stress-responsive transcriptional regulator)/FtsH-binding integral membrane protein
MVPARSAHQAYDMTEIPPAAPSYGPRVTRAQVRDLSTLRRVSDRPMLGGVAEGIARHLDIDPLLVRVVFAALTVFGGAGLVLYLLAWLTIPREDEHDSILSRPLRRDPDRVMTVGLAIAAVVTAATMIGAFRFGAPNPVPLLVVSLVALGVFSLLSRRPDRLGREAPAGAAQAVAACDGTATRPAYDGEATTDVLPVPDGDDGGATGYQPPTPGVPPPPRPPRATRSHLFAITMAVIAITLGALWVYDETGHTVSPSAYPGTALAIIAAGLVVGAWWGRSRLLIFAGLLATLLTVVTSVIGPGPNGERIYTPASTAALPGTYTHGAGQIVVHLEDLVDPANLHGRTLSIKSGIGQVRLTVPSSIDVAVNAHVDHGDIHGLAGKEDLGQGEERVTAVPGSHDLTVDIHLGLGQILVQRVDCPGSTVPADSPITSTTSAGGTDVPAACN